MPEESDFFLVEERPDPVQLQIEFGGLCTYVEHEGAAQILLVAASRTGIRDPKLCTHRRYLVFPGDQETLLGTEGGDFFTSFLDGQGRPWNLWDIDGCQLELGFVGDARKVSPISSRESFEQVLDLDPLAGPIDSKWVTDRLSPSSLVGSRIRFETGLWSGGGLVQEDYSLCVNKENCRAEDGRRFSETIRCQIPETSDVTEICGTHYSSKEIRKVRLKFGAQVSVSNLCTVAPLCQCK